MRSITFCNLFPWCLGYFSTERTTFYDKLEVLAMDPKYGVVKRSEGDEPELHYLLKVFVYSYLTEKAD